MGCANTKNASQTEDPPSSVVWAEKNPIVPYEILPHTTLILLGKPFSSSAEHTFIFSGTRNQDNVSDAINFSKNLKIVSENRAELVVDEELFASIGEGIINGTAKIITKNSVGEARSLPLEISLKFVQHLTPTLSSIQCSKGEADCIYLNTKIKLEGNGLLLGGDEGTTWVELKGTNPLDKGLRFKVMPTSEGNRAQGYFEFSPSIVGIKPTTIQRTLTLINIDPKLTQGVRSNSVSALFKLERTYLRLFGSNTIASLGRYLNFFGRGFIDGMQIRFKGTFLPREPGTTSSPITLDFDFFLDYQSSEWGRYILPDPYLCHQTAEGQINVLKKLVDGWPKECSFQPTTHPNLYKLHQRRYGGTLTGKWTPVLLFNGQEEIGVGTPENFTEKIYIGGVRQVVWIKFVQEGWATGLKQYGLNAADNIIRKRILEFIKTAYQGINILFTLEEPKDTPIYGRLEISNKSIDECMALMGLDATFSKDSFNTRLDDVVGGYNDFTHVTGENKCTDHKSGYGGAFIEPINYYFSQRPWRKINAKYTCPNPVFDQIFDPFRADSGTPLTASEALELKELQSTNGCLQATDRPTQASCAAFILANMIGGSAAHEWGHTLGLSRPYTALPTDPNADDCLCHNPGLMNGACGRPFEERALLNGKGPSQFCTADFEYMQAILPPDPAPNGSGAEFNDPFKSQRLTCTLD